MKEKQGERSVDKNEKRRMGQQTSPQNLNL
jgi:hypothetical protein